MAKPSAKAKPEQQCSFLNKEKHKNGNNKHNSNNDNSYRSNNNM